MSRQRRGHGEGSIHRRPDGRWTATIDLGWQGGKRRRKFLYGKTLAEVAQKLAVALKAHRDGQVFGDKRTTVEQFLRAWLHGVEPSVGPRTWIRYEELIPRHAVPYRQGAADPARGRHLDQLYGELVRAGPFTHHGRATASNPAPCPRDAMPWNLVARNATELVTPPRKARHDFVTFTLSRHATSWRRSRATGWKPSTSSPSPPACAKASSSGCDGADVNLAAGALHLVKRLKTRSSRRQVLLVSVAVDALGRHLAR